ncbi:peptidase T-like protein [Desulfofundulus australicus DSM 11792]|uniref:Peptidase T-like protein n=1 Tax=Desulfofundulus australicus DSM 11792 TaxID=1121425 RepID=A0A1M5AEM5_9FIRM|nr:MULTISPECIES: M20/M25/M40 family metallo-hydrolase [Desulfofundulus]SHF28760.1 peptidase T-like protein [Desulfofundulus australicus DSM 11792]
MVNRDRILAEFLELVQVDSVSGQERAMADLLAARLQELGLEVEEDRAGAETGGEAGNLIATLPARGPERPLLLVAHMDTVEPGRGIKPVVENGIVRSAGNTILGGDDKAGIAAILEVLRVIVEQELAHGGLEVVFTIGEEVGLLGAKHLDTGRLRSSMGYVLDSSGPAGTIVVQAPTQDKIEAVIHGRAAHAGINPEDGINAIAVAAHAVSRMQLGRIDEETTANIGVISGGKATNIVPAYCRLEGETRSLDGGKCRAQTAAMVEVLEKTAAQFHARVEITTTTLYPEFKLDESHPAVVLAKKAAERLGLVPQLIKTGGGSDANILNSRGITCVNLGIAMQKVHTTEEFIRVEDLATNARYLLEIIRMMTA